jgi:DHA1 family bicyclomycin/chloramphenicol resistance-like MFS transporter
LAQSGFVDPARERPARPTRGLVTILGALSAFGPLSMDMYLPGLPSLTHGLGASASTGQLTLTGCMLGIALGQVVAGPLSDSFGRRTPLLAGLIGYIAASAACALAPSIWTLIMLRVIQGIAGGAGVVIARAIVRDLFSGTTAARVFSLLMMVTGVAPVLAPLVGGQALAITSWRGIFVLLAAIGVPLLVVTVLWVPETLPPEHRHGGGLLTTFRTFGRLVSDRNFIPYAVAFSLSFGAMFAYIAGSSFVLEDVFGTSPQLFSVVFAVNSVGLIAVSQLGGHLVGRVGSAYLLRRGLVGTALASLATLIVTVTHAGLAALLVSLFLLLSANGLVLPNGTATALASQQRALGSASALLGLGQFGAGAIVAPLVGVAGPHDALPMAVVIGVCGLGAFVVGLLFSPRGVSGRAVAESEPG